MPMRRRLRASTLFVFLAVAAARPAVAQPAATNWRLFTTSDNLVESWTFDVTRGPSGRLFVSHGEVGHISVFDGYTIERLPAPGPYLTVREGADHTLWAMLRGGGVGNFVSIGVQRLEGGRWVAYPLAESLGPGETSMSAASRAFFPIERDRVLLVGDGRLLDCRIRNGVLEAQRTPVGDGARGVVRFLAPARRGGVWVVTDGTVARIRVAPDGRLQVVDVVAYPAGLGPAQPSALVDSGAAGLFLTLRVRRAGRATDVLIRGGDAAA
jgi:hypothetical protein